MINILSASAFNKLSNADEGVFASRLATLEEKKAATKTDNPPIKPETPAFIPDTAKAAKVINTVTISCNRNILLNTAVVAFSIFSTTSKPAFNTSLICSIF